MSKQEAIPLHVKPKPERKLTYFCRLCRRYDINERKAHLKNYHKADPNAMSKRRINDMIDVIFQESV